MRRIIVLLEAAMHGVTDAFHSARLYVSGGIQSCRQKQLEHPCRGPEQWSGDRNQGWVYPQRAIDWGILLPPHCRKFFLLFFFSIFGFLFSFLFLFSLIFFYIWGSLGTQDVGKITRIFQIFLILQIFTHFFLLFFVEFFFDWIGNHWQTKLQLCRWNFGRGNFKI